MSPPRAGRSGSGRLVVSLDFELSWGMRDTRAHERYRAQLVGVRRAVPALLTAFASHAVHATWAAVGLLFFENLAAARDGLPRLRPPGADPALCPYAYLEHANAIEEELHFAPALIDRIAAQRGQEVASHTFAHHPQLLEAPGVEVFRADLLAAIAVATGRGIALRSLVFPWNQWRNEFLPVAHECGIIAYRGKEPGWEHPANRATHQQRARRALRLLDAYVAVGSEARRERERERERERDVLGETRGEPPHNVHATRFLRPYFPAARPLEPLRLARIERGMTAAAERGELFHLWWHPHNFGIHLEHNLRFLDRVLAHFEHLREQHGMQSLTMSELATEWETA